MEPLECEDGFVDISEDQDGGLLKKILVEGTGDETPPSGSNVCVHYVGTLHSDGSKFDSSRDRPGTFDFQVGVGQVIQGWDVGICSMKKGEKAILRCRSDYAYGDRGSPPKIPGGATLNFEVELFSWKEKVKEPYEMDAKERSEYAAKHKDIGNAAFGKQEWAMAVEAYEEGAKYITHKEDDFGGGRHGGGACTTGCCDDDDDMDVDCENAPAELSDEDKKLALALLSNLAAAQLKLNDADRAVGNCSKALGYDDCNVKALFRRAQAKLALGEFAGAVSDANRVLELDKENKPAEQLIQKAGIAEKQAKKKEKALYSKMFG